MNTKKYFACIHFDSHNLGMKKEQQPPATYSVRIPVEMRKQLEESARAGGRSLHAEILLRLGESLESSSGENQNIDADLEKLMHKIARKAAFEVIQEERQKLNESASPNEGLQLNSEFDEI